jgi:hypothetical protein
MSALLVPGLLIAGALVAFGLFLFLILRGKDGP